MRKRMYRDSGDSEIGSTIISSYFSIVDTYLHLCIPCLGPNTQPSHHETLLRSLFFAQEYSIHGTRIALVYDQSSLSTLCIGLDTQKRSLSRPVSQRLVKLEETLTRRNVRYPIGKVSSE